jgi:hypothetical protein
MGLDLDERAQRLEIGDDALARGETLETAIGLGRGIRDPRVGGQDVDRRQAVPAADLEIVEIMRRRDLDGPRALRRIGIGIGDDGDAPADQRQDRESADQRGMALVVGMHGDGGVAQHRLGPGGGDGDRRARLALDRIGDVPERALHLALLDLEIGDRRVQLRVPVHQSRIAIDQAVAVERDEDLQDRRRQAFVHREALAAPVDGRAEPAQLARDGAAGLALPRPDPRDEVVASDPLAVAALRRDRARAVQRNALGGELTLDHHLRRDAGMVHAGLPERVVALHAPPAHQDVLQCVVERMAHMEAAGDVRRRDHDAIGRTGVPTAAGEGTGPLPGLGPTPLGGGGLEILVERRRRSAALIFLVGHGAGPI